MSNVRMVPDDASYCWRHKPKRSSDNSRDESGTQLSPEQNRKSNRNKNRNPGDSPQKRKAKRVPVGKEDGVYGVLAFVHSARLKKITESDLEALVDDWRSTHPLPDEISSMELAYKYHGPKLSNLDLSGLDLSKMDLRCVQFLHCDLSQTKLNSTMLDGAFLFGCDLSFVDSWVGSFRHANFGQCYIVNSRFMYGRFEGASFKHSNLENTKLIGSYHDRETQYYMARFYGTNLQEAYLEKTNLKEARTLFCVRLYKARIEGAELEYRLFRGKIGEEIDREFDRAACTYSAIKSNLESRGHYAEASKAYIKERQMERAASAPWNARRCYGADQLGDKYEYSRKLDRLVRIQLGSRW